MVRFEQRNKRPNGTIARELTDWHWSLAIHARAVDPSPR
jgi:hypothetical protein